MKLKTFNQSNLPTNPVGKPTIRFSMPSGLVTFSGIAGVNLGLTKETRVELCQNEDVPEDWYVHLTEDESGFALRNRDNDKNFTFNAVAMVKKVLTSVGVEKAASFIISNNPEEISGEKYYYIITKNPIGSR